jgi:RNA polymerase sigma factor (sigma-70 family)
MPPILRYLRSLGAKERLKDVPDGELLVRFTAEQDETAFGVIVRRHGGMVLQVCRSLLHNHADADDAFQATFLVLARQARSIQKKTSLGSWLYGVAYRTALKARAARDTRKRHEAQARTAAPPQTVDELTWREAQGILHEELARLPEKYRGPLVLCYLEGKRQDEAERLLGWPHGRLRSMLERARELLRKRLLRRGLGPSAVLFAAVGLGSAVSAGPAGSLLAGTVSAAAALATTPAAASGVPAQVAALVEGVLRDMSVSKIKLSACALLVVAILGFGAGTLIDRTVAAQERPALVATAPVSTVAPPGNDRARAEPTLKADIVSARASNSWDQNTPERAFDGKRGTMWNAGDYAPQWIEADLGAPRPLASLRLVVTQLPGGVTTHEVWVSDEPIGEDGARAKLVHTFQVHTDNYQQLTVNLPKGLVARYVQILTVESPSWVAWLDIEVRVRRGQANSVPGPAQTAWAAADRRAVPRRADRRPALFGLAYAGVELPRLGERDPIPTLRSAAPTSIPASLIDTGEPCLLPPAPRLEPMFRPVPKAGLGWAGP